MLDFFYFPSLPSTQKWLIEKIKNKKLIKNTCVLSDLQTQGMGSRNNHWENVEDSLMFSFSFPITRLPQDLPLQSLSIYVGFLLKQWLFDQNFEVWMKWPNDLYLQKQKIGGLLTQKVDDYVVCGIGINLWSSHYASLQITWNLEKKVERIRAFLAFLFEFPSWSYIFQNYKIEFHKNFEFTFHFQDREIRFCDATLCEDGSILWKNQKIYSLR